MTPRPGAAEGRERKVYLVVRAGYDSHETLAAFTSERQAREYERNVPIDGLHSPSRESYVLNPAADDLPGVWRVWWHVERRSPEEPFWLSMTPREARKQFRGKMVGFSDDKRWVIGNGVTQAAAKESAEQEIQRLAQRKQRRRRSGARKGE